MAPTQRSLEHEGDGTPPAPEGRPIITIARPSKLSASLPTTRSIFEMIAAHEVARTWKPNCGDSSTSFDADEWKGRFHAAMVDFSGFYKINNHLANDKFSNDDVEYAFAIISLYLAGATLHMMIDPTIKNGGRIDHAARDMPVLVRLAAIENMLKIDKKACSDVILATGIGALQKIIVAAPVVSGKVRVVNDAGNKKRRAEDTSASTPFTIVASPSMQVNLGQWPSVAHAQSSLPSPASISSSSGQVVLANTSVPAGALVPEQVASIDPNLFLAHAEEIASSSSLASDAAATAELQEFVSEHVHYQTELLDEAGWAMKFYSVHGRLPDKWTWSESK